MIQRGRREENPILMVEVATMSPHGSDSEKQDSWRSESTEHMISGESLLLPNQNNVNPILSQLGTENPLIDPRGLLLSGSYANQDAEDILGLTKNQGSMIFVLQLLLVMHVPRTLANS